MTSSVMTLVFSQKEKNPENRDNVYGTYGVLKIVKDLVGEEDNEKFEK